MTDSLFRFASIAVLPLALAACGPSPIDRSAGRSGIAALPERFHGRWDASAAACGGPRGEIRLEVEPDRMNFYESVARVGAIRRGPEGSVRVDLVFEGEGERWTEARTLRVLPDGRLSVAATDGSADRVRCG